MGSLVDSESLALARQSDAVVVAAGIAAEGNPFIRVLVARITFDYKMIPDVPTVEQARKDAKAVRDTIDYFKANGVRVVNMSWGWTYKEIEASLEANGVGQDAAERAEMAKEIKSPVAGCADILITPDVESDNILAKALAYFAKGHMAGVVVGAKCPIVMPSRSDPPQQKMLSLALGVYLCR